jgi:transposase InsO family protein
MKRSVYEQEQDRKSKTRLRMLQHAETISHNVSQTCRFFGISRGQFYIWRHRFEKKGAQGLRDMSRRPNKIRYRIPPEVIALILRVREERRYGAVRMSLYLQRHYQVYVSPTTILKIFHRHHVERVSLKRYHPGPRHREEGPLAVPGRSVQMDVKFVPRLGRARQRFYQFTAIDEATRYRVLRVYDYNNTRSATAFLDQVRQKLPFTIQQIQTDNDSSFGPQFTYHLADLGIHHRRIPPGCPEVNGKVERSHKTDQQEFYDLNRFRDRKDLTRKMRRWEHEYNEDRPHLALEGKTPAERVRQFAPQFKPVRNLC